MSGELLLSKVGSNETKVHLTMQCSLFIAVVLFAAILNAIQK